MKSKVLVTILTIISVLTIDQIIKVMVKTGMFLGERIFVTEWFQILFIENNGMAFGWELGDKIFLTTFRIIAVCVLGWLIIKQIKAESPIGYIFCLSLILAGAAGNIIDCVLYGAIFNESTPFHIAEFVNYGEGYSNLMTGKVVDMFYFPLFDYKLPWMEYPRTFFGAVFNFADSCVTCGAIYLLLFQYRFFAKEEEK
jgi:signal peptidase II